MYKYAIIGMGFIYPHHVEAVEKVGSKIIITCDIDPKKKADFLDYRDMFKSKKFKKEVDAVIICTPNYLHAKMIRDALKTGKRVICEKPLIIDGDFSGLDGVNTVLQLRYHPLLKEMQKAVKKKGNKVSLEMKVCRDKNWWNLWRGDVKKSGGPIFGLAIHLFDLLFVLFGDKFSIVYASNSESKCSGVLVGENVRIKYNIEIMPIKEGQTRNFIINNKKFELCNKDNLSFSGWHYLVYKHFINGDGIPLSEARKSIELIDKIWNKNRCIINDCLNKRKYKNGYCNKHSKQMLKYGKILERTRCKSNRFIKHGNYYEMCLYVGLIEQKEVGRAKIDKDFYRQVKNYKWGIGGGGYIITSNPINKSKKIRLHHLVLGKPPKGVVIDHINGDKTDNRLINLRFLTISHKRR